MDPAEPLGPLTALAIRHGSDKWGPHGYTPHYERHFHPYRDRPIALLEIGVGGYADPRAGGCSLRMWEAYFSQARIFALDIHDKSAHATDRVQVFRGSQAEPEVLHRLHAAAGGFDIVIDDGSHVCAHVITSFQVLFPLLKPGGLYVVEDTQTSYWPALGGSSREPDAATTSMGYFKSLVHGLNHAEILGGAPDYLARNIVSMAFCHNLVFVGKGDNTRPSNVAADDPIRAA